MRLIYEVSVSLIEHFKQFSGCFILLLFANIEFSVEVCHLIQYSAVDVGVEFLGQFSGDLKK